MSFYIKGRISHGVSNYTLLTAASAKLALLLVHQRQLLATLSFLLSCKEAAHSLSLHLLFLHTFYEWSLYEAIPSLWYHIHVTLWLNTMQLKSRTISFASTWWYLTVRASLETHIPHFCSTYSRHSWFSEALLLVYNKWRPTELKNEANAEEKIKAS